MADQQSFEAFTLHQRADAALLSAAHEASEAIEREELLYIESERAIREHRNRADTLEARITAEVSREKDDGTGKPVYSNDTLRKAEVSLRLSNDPAHRDAVKDFAQGEGEQRIRRVRIEKLTRDYSLARLSFEALTLEGGSDKWARDTESE